MASVQIQEHSPTDRPFIRRMLELAALTTYGDLARLGRISLRERLDEIFEQHYGNERKLIWIARQAGTPIGLVWLQPGLHPVTETPDFLVLNLAVDPSHQGQGVGRQLMEHARAYALTRGVRRLRLFVAADNARALGLYEQLGFEERTREMVWDY